METIKLPAEDAVIIRAEFKPKGSPAEGVGVTDVDWLDFYFDADDRYLENWVVQPSPFERSYHEFKADGSLRFSHEDEPCLPPNEVECLLDWLTAIVDPPLTVVRAPRSRPSGLSA